MGEAALPSAAVAAARAGLRVFPLKAGSKEPRLKGGFKAASSDPEFVAGLWSRWQDANIGVDLPPGTIVVDIDAEEGPQRVRGLLGLPAAAAVVRTARGHQGYYLLPEGRALRQGGLDGIGDLKVAGSGYTLLPPSVHPSGAVYEFVRGDIMGIVAATPLAGEHVDALERLRASGANGRALAVEERIPVGRRNQTLASIAGTMRRRGLAEPEIAAALHEINRRRCELLLPGDEVAAIAASICRYEPSPQAAGAVERVTLDDASGSLAAEDVQPFAGRSHAEVLDLEFGDESADLVEGLVPRGVLMTVAGLPETFKGWLCQQIAKAVAAGAGSVFGRDAAGQGAVGYFWQDDSTRNEAERVQLFARVHDTPRELPVRWFLNEGLVLPRDLDRLRSTIERYGLVLVVLDSWYNVAAPLDLKDREAGAVFAQLKADVCDATGCTVIVVDHMPWATETNRKRLRGYGDVFKNAAVRAGIYIDAEGSKLYVEARGNNMRGFKRTPAYWDEDALELRLVDTNNQAEADEEVDASVLEWLIEHPGQHSTTAVRKAVGKKGTRVDKALERLVARDRVRDLGRDAGTGLGQAGTAHGWIATIHADSSLSLLDGTGSDEVASRVPEGATLSHLSHPRRGDRVDRDRVPDKHAGEDDDPLATLTRRVVR